MDPLRRAVPVPRYRGLPARMKHFIQMIDGGLPGGSWSGPEEKGEDIVMGTPFG
ncbi:hypothetical protein [Streptomyces sp. NPDC006510]|uniref:hypothetical protein n=1 Tax=Streptomyces sp. NPDC006510 TaxID=3155600 RepID=UPI0033A590C8